MIQINNAIAQTPPVNDPNGWYIQTSLSEEFTAPVDTVWKWRIQNGVQSNSGYNMDYSRNVKFHGDTLRIKADTLPNYVVNGLDTTFYQGGVITTLFWNYKYGYLEFEAKFPVNEYVWPALWLWSSVCDTPATSYYEEVDIAEQGGNDAFEGHTMGTNWHLWNQQPISCPYNGTLTDNAIAIHNLPRLDSTWHKYALEWNPEGMIWYFDDIPVRTVYDPTNTPKHNMEVIIGVGVDSSAIANRPPYQFYSMDSVFLEVNYMRYYKLNTSHCNNSPLTICNPSVDYSVHGVEKNIITGGTCSPTFNTSDKYVLRATESITLDAGTTISPNGSGQFLMQILQCPQ